MARKKDDSFSDSFLESAVPFLSCGISPHFARFSFFRRTLPSIIFDVLFLPLQTYAYDSPLSSWTWPRICPSGIANGGYFPLFSESPAYLFSDELGLQPPASPSIGKTFLPYGLLEFFVFFLPSTILSLQISLLEGTFSSTNILFFRAMVCPFFA